MATTINTLTPGYKSGSFASSTDNTDGSATFVKEAGGNDFEATDVGRVIWFTDGDQRGEFRKIIEFTNATTVTIDAPFSRHPFRAYTRSNGTAFPAANPAVGDDYTLSLSMAQVAAATGYVTTATNVAVTALVIGRDYEITTVGNTDWTTVGAAASTVGTIFTATAVGNGTGIASELTRDIVQDGNNFTFTNISNIAADNLPYRVIVADDVCIFDEDVTIRVDTYQFRTARNAAFILGYPNGNGTGANSFPYAEGGCWLNDISNRDWENPGSAGHGDWHLYGTTVTALDSPIGDTTRNNANFRIPPFWRLNRDDNQKVRFFETDFSGWHGDRIRGDTSLVIDCTYRGGFIGTGYFANLQSFNPVSGAASFFGLVQGVSINNTDQGIYWWFQESFSGEISGVTASQVSDQVVFFNRNQSTVSNSTLTLANSDLDILENALLDGGNFIRAQGQGTNNSFALRNSLDISIVDGEDALVTETARFAIEDGQGSQPNPTDTTTGTVATQNLILETIALTAGTGATAQTFNILQPGNAANQNAPFSYALHLEGFQPIYRTTQLRRPEDNRFLAAPDVERTVLDTTAVDGYTTLETIERAYDFQARQKFLTPYEPNIVQSYFTKSGTTMTSNAANGFRDITFRTSGAPLAATADEFSINIGGGGLFTGSINSVGEGTNTAGDINLASVRVDGSIATTTNITNLNLQTLFPGVNNRGTATAAATGTVTGSTTINVADGTTRFLVLPIDSGHDLTINKTGTGTLTILGSAPGTYALPGGTNLDPATGITVTGNVNTVTAEAAATGQDTVTNILLTNVTTFPNGTIVEVLQGHGPNGTALPGHPITLTDTNRTIAITTTGFTGTDNQYNLTVSAPNFPPTSWDFTVMQNPRNTGQATLVYQFTPTGINDELVAGSIQFVAINNGTSTDGNSVTSTRTLVTQPALTAGGQIQVEVDHCQTRNETVNGAILKVANVSSGAQTVTMFANDRTNINRLRLCRANITLAAAGTFSEDNPQGTGLAARSWDWGLPQFGDRVFVRNNDAVIFVDADLDEGQQQLGNAFRTEGTDFTRITDSTLSTAIGTLLLATGEPQVIGVDVTTASGAVQIAITNAVGVPANPNTGQVATGLYSEVDTSTAEIILNTDNEIAQAVSDITTNTDTEVAGAITAINTNVDTDIAQAVIDINANTDSQTPADVGAALDSRFGSSLDDDGNITAFPKTQTL